MTGCENLNTAWRALKAIPLRNALTMLGIAIGVGSVFALTAIGSGAQRETEKQIRAPGAQKSPISTISAVWKTELR